MFTADTLYNLLPRFYHLKEKATNDELRALFDVIAREIGIVENDIQRLYDNAFIETCDSWAIPYIGDLLGVDVPHDLAQADFNARARVAGTISHRRRKGTLFMLAQFAADCSGWKVHAVEFMHRLATSQHLKHVRRGAVYTADIGKMIGDSAGAAFDPSPRTVDIRPIDRRRAAVPNIMNVGLFLWRIQSFKIERVRAAAAIEAASGAADGAAEGAYYHLDPLGREMRLFNYHRSDTDIEPEARMPTPLRRTPLAEALAGIKSGRTEGVYSADDPVVEVFLDGEPVPAKKIAVRDLCQWAPPPGDARVSLDPVLGRLAVSADPPFSRVHTSHYYGFSDTIGACPIDREAAAEAFVSVGEGLDWLIEVNQSRPPVAGKRVVTLRTAIEAWNLKPPGTCGAILITDSERYEEDLDAHALKLPVGSRLLMLAADTPEEIDPDMSASEWPWTAANVRPSILGGLRIDGEGGTETGGSLGLNGLLVKGDITLVAGRIQACEIDRCTVTGDHTGRLRVPSGQGCRTISIRAARVNGLELDDDHAARITIEDSLLEGEDVSIKAPRANLALSHCTLMGATECETVNADGCIFMQPLNAARTQTGCVRYSYLPLESISPRPHRCQPQLAMKTAPPGEREQTRLRLRPTFTSLEQHHYAYAQLSHACAEEIRTGAENGAEMGAFNRLMQPQREANIRSGLQYYLRWGLNAGLIPVT